MRQIAAQTDESLVELLDRMARKASFAKFRHLVSQTTRDAAQKNQLVSNTQADLLVWQRLEDELLKTPVLRSTCT